MTQLFAARSIYTHLHYVLCKTAAKWEKCKVFSWRWKKHRGNLWRRCKTIATMSLIRKGSRKLFNSQSNPPHFSVYAIHLKILYALVVFKELSKGAKPSSKVDLKRRRLENGYHIELHTQRHLPTCLTGLCLAQEEVRLLNSWCLYLFVSKFLCIGGFLWYFST